MKENNELTLIDADQKQIEKLFSKLSVYNQKQQPFTQQPENIEFSKLAVLDKKL